MKPTPTLRKHLIVLIMALYVIYRFINVGLTVPHDYLEDVRQGRAINCEDEGETRFPAQYLAAPDILEQCRE